MEAPRGRDGVQGERGQRGQRGQDSAPGRATLVFVILTLILIGVVAVQALTFRDFSQRICTLTRSAADLRMQQAKAYREFASQESTNRFIDEDLRNRRVATWTGLAVKADKTVVPARELCP